MTKKEALALAKKEYGQFDIRVRGNEVIVTDNSGFGLLVTKIKFSDPVQKELF